MGISMGSSVSAAIGPILAQNRGKNTYRRGLTISADSFDRPPALDSADVALVSDILLGSLLEVRELSRPLAGPGAVVLGPEPLVLPFKKNNCPGAISRAEGKADSPAVRREADSQAKKMVPRLLIKNGAFGAAGHRSTQGAGNRAGHLAPDPALEGSALSLLLRPSPLFEEERDFLLETLVPDRLDPRFFKGPGARS